MPNAQGGYTAEEEAEAVERAIREGYLSQNASAFPEQTPSLLEQLAQGPNAVAAGLLTNNAGYQASLQESMVGEEPFAIGLGPPYAETPRPYNGPPPMEAQPDWNYDSAFPGNWHDYSSNNTTTGGGFFSIDELFRGPVPNAFQSGSNMPSTNNWRLLPPPYRHPNYIMRNGRIIDVNSAEMSSPYGPSSMSGQNPTWRSGSAVGFPSGYAPGPASWAVYGWPGQVGNFAGNPGGT